MRVHWFRLCHDGDMNQASIVDSPCLLSLDRSWHLPTCRVVITDIGYRQPHHRNPPTHSNADQYGKAPLTHSGPHAYASPDQSFDTLCHHPSTTGKCYQSIIDNPESGSDLPHRKKPRPGWGAEILQNLLFRLKPHLHKWTCVLVVTDRQSCPSMPVGWHT